MGPVRNQPAFCNAVVEVETTLSPEALLDRCLKVERGLGRRRTLVKGPRTLDLDILLFEDLVLCEPRLTVPHPELVARAFALVPLLELAPMAVDPRDGKLLCRYAGPVLRCQPIVKLGSLRGFRARHRLATRHFPPDQDERVRRRDAADEADRRPGTVTSVA